MFNDDYSITNDRPRGALEVAMHARAQEKAQAFLVANYQEKKEFSSKKNSSNHKGLLASFFAIFRAI